MLVYDNYPFALSLTWQVMIVAAILIAILWLIFCMVVGMRTWPFYAPPLVAIAVMLVLASIHMDKVLEVNNRVSVFFTSQTSCNGLEKDLVRWQIERKQSQLPKYESTLAYYGGGSLREDILWAPPPEEVGRVWSVWIRADLASRTSVLAALERCHLPTGAYRETIGRLETYQQELDNLLIRRKTNAEQLLTKLEKQLESLKDERFQMELDHQRAYPR